MQTQFVFDQHLYGRCQDIRLRQLVSRLVTGLLPDSARQESFIINDISPAIMVTTDELLLATVISNLLSMSVSRNRRSCIRVTAKVFSNVILLFVRDQKRSEKQITNEDFARLQPLAYKVGGCITISSQDQWEETLALSFLDLAAVA